MILPAIQRRSFLGLTLLMGFRPDTVLSGQNTAPIFLSAASDNQGQHWLKAFTLVDQQLLVLYSHQLSERAHAVVLNPAKEMFVTLARRPGTFMLTGRVQSGEVIQEIQAPAGRHFYGHGVFSADGEYFYTTESDYEDMQGDSGRIGIWQLNRSDHSLQRIGELPSYGVGPHELLLMPDGDTLVIANGGIRTHPDSDRDMLNVDSMQPSLAYIDRHTGTLLEQRLLPEEFHQASIRHIDMNAAGQIAIAIQFEGEPFIRAPLIATHQRGEELRTLMAPEQLQSQMQQYVGSIRFDHSGRYFVASCPRANMLTFWDAEQGEFVKQLRARDACGVCAFENGFVYSAGTGRVSYFDMLSDRVEELSEGVEGLSGLFWDNHLVVANA